MDCLRDFIGLNWCGATGTPASGLYVNDLAGISLKQITSLTDEETATFSALWTTIQKRAESRFGVDVREAIGKRYKLSSINQGGYIGKEITGTATASTGGFNGFVIELLPSADSDYMDSAMSFISVQTLQFYANGADATEVKEVAIFDLLTGDKLFTTNVTLVAGWNTVQVNTRLTNSYNQLPKNVFCGINTTGLSTFDLDIPLSGSLASCCRARLRGASTDATTGITEDDLTFGSNSYGMSGVFTIGCAWDGFVCQNKALFARPYWYCLGIELLTEQIYSTRLNSYTTIGMQKAKELREEYMTEYMRTLNQICTNIEMECDCCIECADQLQLVTTNQFY